MHFAVLCLVVGFHLVLSWVVPAPQLRFWFQLAYLCLQVGLASLANLILPSPLLGYVYLVIVLQAVYLFRPLVWVIFASCVYVLWSGSLMIVSASFIDWAHGNLLLAFPVLCILIAAITYARQHRHHEQVQHILQQMQRQYETLHQHLRDAQELAALEERRQLAQTIVSDITAALAQAELSIASAISQAQTTNFARLSASVAQTRAATAITIDRMRSAIAGLRLGTREAQLPGALSPTLELPPDELMTMRSQRALLWSLPLAFVGIALPLAILQQPITPALGGLFALCCAVLLGGYVFTQRIRNPLLVFAGLCGQAAAVLGMVVVTHTVPLALGLLLVVWQTAMRLSGGHIVALLVGVQTLIGLALVRLLPVPNIDTAYLITICVTCLAITGLVGTARRQLGRRRMTEAHLVRLAHLTRDLEQQLAQVRMLAVAVERTRLAREIHDDLGHRLMLLTVQLQLVEEMIEEDPSSAIGQLCSTREQLREAWSSTLGSADAVLAIDGPTLAPAIHRLVDQCRTLTPMRIELRIIGDPSYLEAPVACTLYRTVQEGLTNACKYAHAEQAHVLVYCDDAEARVIVRDDGCGEAADTAQGAASAGTHFGLKSLRERAELLGGNLEAGPLPTQGFMVTLAIPLA
jgi:signal transduction histidine kinase